MAKGNSLIPESVLHAQSNTSDAILVKIRIHLHRNCNHFSCTDISTGSGGILIRLHTSASANISIRVYTILLTFYLSSATVN